MMTHEHRMSKASGMQTESYVNKFHLTYGTIHCLGLKHLQCNSKISLHKQTGYSVKVLSH